MKRTKIKSILAVLVAMCLCLTAFYGCGDNENTGDVTENNPTTGTTMPTETEEIAPEVFYTGVVYQLPAGGTAKFNALKTDGTYDELGERGVYGYPEITEDGKYIFYRQTQANADTREYTERLFVKQPGQKAFELAEYAKSFVLSKDESCVAAVCEDGIYFTDDFSQKCEKLVDNTEFVSTCVISQTNKTVVFLDDNGKLTAVDVATKTATVVDTDVTYVMRRVCDNALYYAKESGFYLWNGSASSFVSDWWKSTDFVQIFAVGTERDRQYYYLTATGKVFEIDGEIEVSSFSAMSPNEKYFVTDSGDTIYRYEITDTGFVNKTEFKGKDMNIYSVNNDGVVVACSSSESSFGIFENSAYKKLSDGILLAHQKGYSSCVHFAKGCVYYCAEDTLYKYTFGGTSEMIAENVFSFVANGDHCYYTTNYNKSKEYGDLYSVGADTMIDDYVKYVYIR